jgi:hypothetical protein
LTVGIKVVSYDLNINPFPDTVEYTTIMPAVYMYPQGALTDEPIKYKGKIQAGEVLSFIEQHTGFGFKFPFNVKLIGKSKENVDLTTETIFQDDLEAPSQKSEL